MTTGRTLTACVTEGLESVSLTLNDPLTGERHLAISIPQFADSLREWVERPTEVQQIGHTPLTEIIAALRRPDAWAVNALTTPMRYALMIHKNTRVAVHTRPAQTMGLFYNDDEDEETQELTFIVPPRCVGAVWEGSTLRAGIVLLAKREQDLPKALNDELTQLDPWIWGNVFEDGGVCWGTTTRPVYGQDGISNVDHAFFTSVFNHDICRYRRGDEDGHHTLASYYEECFEDGNMSMPPTLPAHGSNMTTSLFKALERAISNPH